MDKNAASDFANALQLVVHKAMKNNVPLDFMVARLEIVKTDIANRYLNQQAALQAQDLAKQLANGIPKATTLEN